MCIRDSGSSIENYKIVSDQIEKRIDYIFVKKMEILSHQHLDLRLRNGNHISDHLPVIIKAKVGK